MLSVHHTHTLFNDRYDAGSRLVKHLRKYVKNNPYLLALPRGGVEVAYEIAKKMKIPMSVIIARKIGSPLNPEYAIGAISEGNVTVIDNNAIQAWEIPQDTLNKIIKQENHELDRRIRLYRKNKNLSFLKGKTIIVVDDGIATGQTAVAALKSIKKLYPKSIIFASPVCASESLPEVSQYTDAIVCLVTPTDLSAISEYYKTFHQTTDKKVLKLLSMADCRLSPILSQQ